MEATPDIQLYCPEIAERIPEGVRDHSFIRFYLKSMKIWENVLSPQNNRQEYRWPSPLSRLCCWWCSLQPLEDKEDEAYWEERRVSLEVERHFREVDALKKGVYPAAIPEAAWRRQLSHTFPDHQPFSISILDVSGRQLWKWNIWKQKSTGISLTSINSTQSQRTLSCQNIDRAWSTNSKPTRKVCDLPVHVGHSHPECFLWTLGSRSI